MEMWGAGSAQSWEREIEQGNKEVSLPNRKSKTLFTSHSIVGEPLAEFGGQDKRN